MKKMFLNVSGNVLAVLCAVLLVWLGINWAEITMKNVKENPEYSKANVLVWIIDELADTAM